MTIQGADIFTAAIVNLWVIWAAFVFYVKPACEKRATENAGVEKWMLREIISQCAAKTGAHVPASADLYSLARVPKAVDLHIRVMGASISDMHKALDSIKATGFSAETFAAACETLADVKPWTKPALGTFHCPKWPQCGCPDGGVDAACPALAAKRGEGQNS